ncbi:hypothetical protein DSO57_1035499 [Entomophthora muscae]|uniref:Uncharacterized protein n=1 Tax=Entomophthora muscae TaxID=34485 RepID=A0ACC2UK54_9FUNG|nr:hypothetical protein DSO57_1035499 [Entomophthora muscae]
MCTKIHSFLTTDDDLELDIEIHFPLENPIGSKDPTGTTPSASKGSNDLKRYNTLAILLHPYGPLGGSKDDRVIRKLSAQMAKKNIIVAAPNLRGVGSSQGSTSWTAKGECQDLKSILCAFLLPHKENMWDNPIISQTLKANFDYSYSEIILVGYSFGAMVASSITHDTIHEIVSMNNPDQFPHCPTLSTILLSYPLGVAWALSLWKVFDFKRLFTELVSSTITSSQPVSEGRLLIIFGGKDQFTSYSSYKTWVQGKGILLQADDHHESSSEVGPLQVRSNSQGDHFWAREVDLDWLIQEIFCWLEI